MWTLDKRISLAFSTFSRRLSVWAGRPSAFLVALLLIVLWLILGPPFDYSDTWQLVINTSTTIITFLMVFLIQHTQNRDTEEIQIKLNELIRATRGAHNTMVALDQWDDEELEAHLRQYSAIADEAKRRLQRGLADEDCPQVSIPANSPVPPLDGEKDR